MSLWLLWWPSTGSSMFMVVVMLLMYSALHCLYSVGKKGPLLLLQLSVNVCRQHCNSAEIACRLNEKCYSYHVIPVHMWVNSCLWSSEGRDLSACLYRFGWDTVVILNSHKLFFISDMIRCYMWQVTWEKWTQLCYWEAVVIDLFLSNVVYFTIQTSCAHIDHAS